MTPKRKKRTQKLMTAAQIAAVRSRLGLSQQKMGRVVGRAQSAINRMETLGTDDILMTACLTDEVILQRLIVRAGLALPERVD